MTDTDKKTVKQKALAHFKAKMAGELYSFDVPEWDCKVYHRGISNMLVESKIMSLTSQGKTADALVESIVQKALDENGKRLFKDTDRIELMNEADPQVIISVASRLNRLISEDTIEEIEKNS